MGTMTNNEINHFSVLLVEDEPIVQMVVTAMLKKFSCQVDLAMTGQEALAKASYHYDLILMDLGLPDMRGSEVTAKIRQIERDQHMPIIAVSGYSISEIEKECKDAGVDAIYNKPLSLDNLQQILKNYGHV